MRRPSVRPSVRLAVVEDGYIAYDADSDRVHHLNATAALILELCDGTRDVGEIQAAMIPLLPHEHLQSVAAWIETAEQDGLITYDPVPNAPGLAMEADELATLADRLRDEGSVQQAFLCAKRATELRPEDAAKWHQLGELAHIAGNRDVARSAFQSYLEFEPDDNEIKHILVALCDQPTPDRASDECIQQLYARFSKFYETNMRGELGYRGPEELLTALAPHLPSTPAGLHVLDLGCGTGLAGELLRPWAVRLVGIDLSPEMVERARRRNIYDTLEVAEITAWLSKDEQTYDLIVACDLLIYFGELGQVLRPSAARLRPGGLLGVTTEKAIEADYKLTDSGRYAHHRNYVREIATQAGFVPLSQNEISLREEYGETVVGIVTVLRAPSLTTRPQ